MSCDIFADYDGTVLNSMGEESTGLQHVNSGVLNKSSSVYEFEAGIMSSEKFEFAQVIKYCYYLSLSREKINGCWIKKIKFVEGNSFKVEEKIYFSNKAWRGGGNCIVLYILNIPGPTLNFSRMRWTGSWRSWPPPSNSSRRRTTGRPGSDINR